MEDEGNEFRSRVVSKDGSIESSALAKPLKRREVKHSKQPVSDIEEQSVDRCYDEPTELTPELVAYWEKVLIEHGEAPADDGFGEIDVSTRIPVHGVRKARNRK